MGANGLRVFASLFLGAQLVFSLFAVLCGSDWVERVLNVDDDYSIAIVLGAAFALCSISASIATLLDGPRFPRLVASTGLLSLSILIALLGIHDAPYDLTFHLIVGTSLLALTVALVFVLGATSWWWRLQVVYGSKALLAKTRPQFHLWQLLATITVVATLLGIGRWLATQLDVNMAASGSTNIIAVTFAILVAFASMATLLTLLGWLTPRLVYVVVPLTFLLTTGIALLEWPTLEFMRGQPGPPNDTGMRLMLTLNGVQYAWLSLSLVSARLAGFRLVAKSAT